MPMGRTVAVLFRPSPTDHLEGPPSRFSCGKLSLMGDKSRGSLIQVAWIAAITLSIVVAFLLFRSGGPDRGTYNGFASERCDSMLQVYAGYEHSDPEAVRGGYERFIASDNESQGVRGPITPEAKTVVFNSGDATGVLYASSFNTVGSDLSWGKEVLSAKGQRIVDRAVTQCHAFLESD